MEGKRYKGMFIYYDPKTQEEWTDTEWCNAYNLEQAKEILKKRNPNLIWVCSEDNKEGWHIKEDKSDWKSRSEILYGINNKQVYESMNIKKQTIKLNESQLRNIIKESIKKVLTENFQKPENWKDTPFQGTYQDEDGSIYMPDDDYEIIDDDYNDTKDLYFKLDDPYNAEKLLQQIQSDLENNFININGVFNLEPVNEKNYEYKIPNLSYDEYEDIYNFLSDTYHDELWIEE